ncbi:MAG: hypothetical protein ABIF12_02695 [bacterium]
MLKKICLFFIVFINLNLYSMQLSSDQEPNFGNLVIALINDSYDNVHEILKSNPLLILEKSGNGRNIFYYIGESEDFYEDEELDLSRIRLFLIEKLIDVLSKDKYKTKRYWKKILKRQIELLPKKTIKVRLCLAIKKI